MSTDHAMQLWSSLLKELSNHSLKNQVCENDEAPSTEKLVMVLENDNKETCWTSPLEGEKKLFIISSIRSFSVYPNIDEGH